MTKDDSSDGITSDEEFEAELAAAIEAAVRGDVDVRGAWEVRSRERSDWEVQISELVRDATADE